MAISTPTDKLTYTAAITYCEQPDAGRHHRLAFARPSKTLYSLIEFQGTDPSGYSGMDTSGLTPFIDTSYFAFAYGDTAAGERIIDAQYASSTHYVLNHRQQRPHTIFGVNFADGRIKGYDLIMPNGGDEVFLCAMRARQHPLRRQCLRGQRRSDHHRQRHRSDVD